MAEFYQDMQDLATSLLRQFKQGVVQLQLKTVATAGASTPWTPGAETTTTLTLSATVSGVSKKYVDDKMILGDDLQVTAAVVALTSAGVKTLIDPNLIDKVLINGKVHELKTVKQIPASGTPVTFILFVAK